MRSVSDAEARARLGELLDEVGRGEELVITREGSPVARLAPLGERSAARLDLGALRAFRDTLPPQPTTAGEFVRWMRDTDRY